MSSLQRPTKKKAQKRNASTKTVRTTTSTVKTSAQPSKTRNRRRRRKGNPRPELDLISPCAKKFLLAVTDPFNMEAYGVCVPVGGHKTYKTHAWLRGILTTNGNGFAWIQAMPTIAYDATCLYTGDASGTGYPAYPFISALSANNVLFAGVNRVNLALPYPTSLFLGIGNQAANSGRIVAAGLRVRYIGNQLNMGGQVYTFRDPDHSSVQVDAANDPSQFASWSQRTECAVDPLNRSWVTVSDFGKDVDEFEIHTFQRENQLVNLTSNAQTAVLYPFSKGTQGQTTITGGGPVIYTDVISTGITVGVPTMGVMVIGQPNQAIAYEYIQHVEYSGPAIAASATRTDVDPVGAARVSDAMAEAQGASGLLSGATSVARRAWENMFREADAASAKSLNGPARRRAARFAADAIAATVFYDEQKY